MSLSIFLTQPARRNAADAENSDELYSANITHNLCAMAREAGLFDACWRPEESGLKAARQLVGPLRAGIASLEDDRPRFEKFNDSNGWGTYDQFLPWLRELLAACVQNPTAQVRASV